MLAVLYHTEITPLVEAKAKEVVLEWCLSFSLHTSAVLRISAVILFCASFTPEPRRTAEVRRGD